MSDVKYQISVNTEKCMGCGTCVITCVALGHEPPIRHVTVSESVINGKPHTVYNSVTGDDNSGVMMQICESCQRANGKSIPACVYSCPNGAMSFSQIDMQ